MTLPASSLPSLGPRVPAPHMPALAAETAFGRALALAEGRAPRTTEPEKARQAAEDFVAMAFVEPILEQIRETNQAAPPFAPTNGEKQFRAMLDATLAREITRAARFPLVDRLARDLRRAAAMEAEHTHAVRA
jgi:Rod binding domain-containing protein